MAEPTKIKLLKFFIFNTSFGDVEGEEYKKLIYYYSLDEICVESRLKDVGLCEALVNFTRTFDPDSPCDTLCTQKTHQYLLDAGDNFWLSMVVQVPMTEHTSDEGEATEFHGDEVHDTVYKAVLKRCYDLFSLFNSTFGSIMEKTQNNIDLLKLSVESFFNSYLPTLRLDRCDLSDIHLGLHFLPMEKEKFLQIQCFINQVQEVFPLIKLTCFLYTDLLVWSGLEQEDMTILNHYLVTKIFPASLEKDLKKHPASVPSLQFGKFIVGPDNWEDVDGMKNLPLIYLNKSTKDPYRLMIYKASNAEMCFLLNCDVAELNVSFYKKLDGFLGPLLTNLSCTIGDLHSRVQGSSVVGSQYKYIYFNHMNCAQKSTIHLDQRKTGAVVVPAEVIKLFGDVHDDIRKIPGGGEMYVKSMSNQWIHAKLSDSREFYTSLSSKCTNLIEASDEVQKLCASQFHNIFFVD